jgi:hypothetical protein
MFNTFRVDKLSFANGINVPLDIIKPYFITLPVLILEKKFLFSISGLGGQAHGRAQVVL